MWSLYFFKLFSSENYSDDFEDEEDIDAPLPTKDGETNCKENPISEKTKAPKQVGMHQLYIWQFRNLFHYLSWQHLKSLKYEESFIVLLIAVTF